MTELWFKTYFKHQCSVPVDSVGNLLCLISVSNSLVSSVILFSVFFSCVQTLFVYVYEHYFLGAWVFGFGVLDIVFPLFTVPFY
jgi:hypothetical protein